MRAITLLLVASAALIASSPLFPSVSYAEDTRLIATEQNPVQKSLEKIVGQSVTLKLSSGEEVGGVVAKVGPEAVQLTQLQGKEFFDALIPLQKIEAVIVRAKS